MNSINNFFKGKGASYLISEDNYDQYVTGKDYIGRTDGQFVTTDNEMDNMLKEANGNPRIMEKNLGLNEGDLGNRPIRVDIYNPRQYNLREANDLMSGANKYYIEGGKTKGGMCEAVIDPFPNPEQHPEVGRVSEVTTNKGESDEIDRVGNENHNESKINSGKKDGEAPPSDGETDSNKLSDSEDNSYYYGQSM